MNNSKQIFFLCTMCHNIKDDFGIFSKEFLGELKICNKCLEKSGVVSEEWKRLETLYIEQKEKFKKIELEYEKVAYQDFNKIFQYHPNSNLKEIFSR